MGIVSRFVPMESDRSGFSIRLDETSPGLRKGPSAWPEKAGEASWIDIFHAARVSAARETVNRMDRLFLVCFLWTNVSYLVGSWLGGRTAGGDREGDVDHKTLAMCRNLEVNCRISKGGGFRIVWIPES
ncbi:hypothetical protein E4U60_001802 [Claviceps pazoutovae]|uniref:Uncharacterized protein n=1 Tax=Claviceps pazoutovae TaxID=1649127 RepID=A0A9P7MCG5_9HYPO|nr:hypothetical protein E4U60_001802 [Claviceps pazoutovae]